AADGNGIGFWVISDVELCRDYHCLTMETYKRHFKAAHGDSHLCALCDNQSFVDTETFQTHCNVEHPPMTHRCDMCPEGFDNAYTFALHHLFKSAVHPKCSMCRVGFETKDGLLQQHYNPSSNQPRCELGRAKLEDSKVISQHPQDIHEAVPVEKLDLERADEVFSILTVWLLCSLHVMLPAATHDYAICGICGAAAICFIIPVCDLTKITVINVDPRGPSWSIWSGRHPIFHVCFSCRELITFRGVDAWKRGFSASCVDANVGGLYAFLRDACFRMPVPEASPAPEGFPGAIPGIFRILPPINHQLATERVPSPTLRPRSWEMGSEAKSKHSCVSQSWAPMFLASPCSEALELDNQTDVRLPNRDCIIEALIADGRFECAVCKRPILLRLDVTSH
ncbi:predicted protein, partial [Postia placenta Mad-698-R]